MLGFCRWNQRQRRLSKSVRRNRLRRRRDPLQPQASLRGRQSQRDLELGIKQHRICPVRRTTESFRLYGSPRTTLKRVQLLKTRRTPIPDDLYGTLTWRRLVVKKREARLRTTSYMTEQLKRSFETHCDNEHGAGFHVYPFDENGNEILVTDEDKAKWDVLWRMESEKFDEECSKIPKYQNLVNRKFSTWDGNHRVITWMEVLSTPLNAYKDMIGDDVYDEFEKSRMKTPMNRPWYNENMTSMAAAYILSFAEVTAPKEAHGATEEAEEKRLGKALTAKAK
ncbi:hypothetical protein R1sor_027031 [Riccia sorocarpa]|uniref:Uncharacterized protein n=1 Tax=Riccia sorocarpa TaxID=122646 RepID=A0ABD3GD21_9MARC